MFVLSLSFAKKVMSQWQIFLRACPTSWRKNSWYRYGRAYEEITCEAIIWNINFVGQILTNYCHWPTHSTLGAVVPTSNG